MRKINSLSYVDALTHVIFPNVCAHCAAEISRFESNLCHVCWEKVLPTYFEKYKEPSPLDQLFFGRTKLKSTYSLFHFHEDNPIQSLLHGMKYKNKKKVGTYLGKLLGEKLRERHITQPFDVLMPVPIHPKKEFQRGFNQCDALCEGAASILNIPIDKRFLKKIKNTSSQTKKSKWERWENSLDNFYVRQQDIAYNHLLIIDDVITTGSTLESLCNLLTKAYPHLEISVASIAYAGT
jgi:ComF family protein